MPPPSHGKRSRGEIETLTDWVAAGGPVCQALVAT